MENKSKFNIQLYIALVALFLFGIKLYAYLITNSVAILSDALESIVNIATGFFGLYSIYLSNRPKDKNHPYGHGKVEFISAGIEGTLILIAGILIIYNAWDGIQHPREVSKLSIGIWIMMGTAIVNYAFGHQAIKNGEKHHSIALIASGNHLKSDTYSTLGILIGLVVLKFTGLAWIDAAVALVFALIIMYSGYVIIRKSVAGIMDEADAKLLNKLVKHVNKVRKAEWIDLHNLRIIKYGGILHIDCHLTVPWYLNVREAHDLVDELEDQVRAKFGDQVELFIHTDDCYEKSCKICSIEGCKVRQAEFTKKITWNVENISVNKRHSINS
jgi:cation diffusion facilitator family transporter